MTHMTTHRLPCHQSRYHSGARRLYSLAAVICSASSSSSSILHPPSSSSSSSYHPSFFCHLSPSSFPVSFLLPIIEIVFSVSEVYLKASLSLPLRLASYRLIRLSPYLSPP